MNLLSTVRFAGVIIIIIIIIIIIYLFIYFLLNAFIQLFF